LGEKLRSSFFVSPISKPFQKYYLKAREGRSVQSDEDLLAESVAVVRLPVNFIVEEAVAVLQVKDNPYISKKGFLWRGFINSSPAMKASTPHSSLLESVVSSLTLDVKEDGVIVSIGLNTSICEGCRII
jgi:hypothetical protein